MWSDLVIVGRKDTVAFEIAGYAEGSPDLRVVDIWLGGVKATHTDNSAYLPSFIHSLEKDLASLSEPGLQSHKKVTSSSEARRHIFRRMSKRALRYKIFNLGETTQDLRAFAFAKAESIFIVFTLRLNSKHHVVSVSKQELTENIRNAISACKSV
jgi:hypothetical protein